MKDFSIMRTEISSTCIFATDIIQQHALTLRGTIRPTSIINLVDSRVVWAPTLTFLHLPFWINDRTLAMPVQVALGFLQKRLHILGLLGWVDVLTIDKSVFLPPLSGMTVPEPTLILLVSVLMRIFFTDIAGVPLSAIINKPTFWPIILIFMNLFAISHNNGFSGGRIIDILISILMRSIGSIFVLFFITSVIIIVMIFIWFVIIPLLMQILILLPYFILILLPYFLLILFSLRICYLSVFLTWITTFMVNGQHQNPDDKGQADKYHTTYRQGQQTSWVIHWTCAIVDLFL